MNKSRFIELLTQFLGVELTAAQSLESWPEGDLANDKLLGNAWHAIYRFSMDEDVHAKDPSYELRQREAIRAIVLALRRRNGD